MPSDLIKIEAVRPRAVGYAVLGCWGWAGLGSWTGWLTVCALRFGARVIPGYQLC
jgi:hypothetical protein